MCPPMVEYMAMDEGSKRARHVAATLFATAATGRGPSLST